MQLPFIMQLPHIYQSAVIRKHNRIFTLSNKQTIKNF